MRENQSIQTPPTLDGERNELPHGWILARLEELTENPKQDIVDGPFGSNLKASEYVAEGVPIVRLQNIERNRFLEKNIRYATQQKAKELARHSFRAGDVIVSKLGDPVGKACIIPLDFSNGIIVADVVRVRIDEGRASKKFVTYAINSPAVAARINLEVKGSTRPRVNLGHIRALEIPLAPLAEQRRVVAKLEALLDKVDACKQRLAKIPALLKRFRQSVLAAACSGRLTAGWREENQEAETAAVLLKKFSGSAEISEPNDLPATWIRCRLESLADLITKGASPRWQGISYTDTGVLFVTSENVGWGKMLLDQRKFVEPRINEIQPRSVLQKGDLLTNIVGASIGRSAIYELDEIANTNQAVALIRLIACLEKRYILYVLNSPPLVEHMHCQEVDVARSNVSLSDVRKFPIPLPPLSEQQEIIRRVESMFALAGQIEARLAKAQAHAEKLTESLLARAFRGLLVSQDPNDEPSSALLERIRKSKDISVKPGRKTLFRCSA